MLWVLAALFLISCSNDETREESEGRIKFSVQNILNQGNSRTDDAADITHALITVEDDQGALILDQAEVSVTSFGEGFVTDPITLEVGDYFLTGFLLLNESDEVIYATPLTGSDLDYLVDNPLPIGFTITNGQSTQLSPETIDVASSLPEEYGYSGINFTIIETFDLMISVLELNGGSYSPTAYTLTVQANGSDVTTKEFPQGVSVVKLRTDVANYTLNIVTTSGAVYSADYQVSELIEHDVDTNDPLTIQIGSSDVDGDGYSVENGDCDDGNAQINPGATEICDNLVDDNCDGLVDEGCPNGDADGDGFSPNQGDCNDNDPNVNPGAQEVCDLQDNNCNNLIDEECDIDGDGFTFFQGDCDDFDPNIYPGAPEICDGIDNNCDGNIDEVCNDNDGDGFTVFDGDCNDFQASVYPGATELCDGLDNNCDGTVDEGCQNADTDGDGVTIAQGDCDDNNPNVYPGAPEICGNAVDENCNGPIDEDRDCDGFTLGDGDCDDFNPTVNPGHPELCDGFDNNCDGQVDNGCV